MLSTYSSFLTGSDDFSLLSDCLLLQFFPSLLTQGAEVALGLVEAVAVVMQIEEQVEAEVRSALHYYAFLHSDRAPLPYIVLIRTSFIHSFFPSFIPSSLYTFLSFMPLISVLHFFSIAYLLLSQAL